MKKEQDLLNQLKAFKGRIPGIVELTAGINTTGEIEAKTRIYLGITYYV
ncbi:hypothetical protein GCM10020331_087870 [Ectobacillus funiculus]